MPSSHHYDLKRLPRNPIKKAGSDAGRQQRKTDRQRGVYPREGLPISRKDREALWISAYQEAYYQPKATGHPMRGDMPRVQISVMVDRALLEQADLAGINRSEAIAVGLRLMLNPKTIA
jgi:hypothetical protein